MRQDRLLRMEPVVGLRKEDAAVAISDSVGYLLAAVGRQTVHHEDVPVFHTLYQLTW